MSYYINNTMSIGSDPFAPVLGPYRGFAKIGDAPLTFLPSCGKSPFLVYYTRV